MIAIKSNTVLLPKGVQPACVVLDESKIVAVGEINMALPNCTIVDVLELLVMPGVIDPHVHINEPGRTDWEGFETATSAAIAGGVTTLVDMPLNSSPVTTNVAAFEQKLISANKNKHTNLGFWGGVIPGNENEIEGLIQKGVLGFKAFLTHSGIDDFPNATEDDLRKVLPIFAKYDLPLLVHCELTDGINRDKGDVRSYANYLATRPDFWEDEAIAMMIRLSEEFDCRIHIVHLSTANSIQQIKEAKEKGIKISVETGQHYLYFAAEDILEGQTQFKCAPPIRSKSNNEKLWDALRSGIIDFVATDHSPATPDLKEIESGNFMKAWGGIASIQFAFPVLWTAAKKRGYSIVEVAKWLCENPAKLIGKEKTKGKIEVGFDADIIIIDPNKSFRVEKDIILHKHKVTPYLNEILYGVVKQTYLNGVKVYENGSVLELSKGTIIKK